VARRPGWLGVQQAQHGVDVEAHATARAAEADGVQILGMGVDPGAVDPEPRRELRCIDEPDALLWLSLLDDRDDALGDRIDVGGVESHIPQAAETGPGAIGLRRGHGRFRLGRA
jgi:hypothetical protein